MSVMYKYKNLGKIGFLEIETYGLDKLKSMSWELDGTKLEEILDKEATDMIEHFTKNGWDLNRESIRENIIHQIFGIHLLEVIDQYLAKKANVTINVTDDVFELNEEYKPIYMNDKTGEIVLIEDIKDKSYVFKYKESNGYTLIGRL